METQYNDDQYQANYPDGIENNYWNVGRNKTILSVIGKYGINNIMDVGCGRGIVTSYLYEHGVNITGVELGQATPIRKTGCKILYNTDVMAVPKEERDAVKALTFFDVIEHIEDPKAFVSSVGQHYAKHEYIIITVPARKELWSNYDVFYGHYRRYDLKMTKDFFDGLGYEIVENRYFFHALYLLIRMSNFIRTDRELKYVSPVGVSKLIQAFIGTLFYLERFFVPGKVLGSSVLCVAKKK